MVPIDNSSSNFDELDIGNSAESFGKFLESQRELFHGQVVQLQNIVITQCKLTGVNPLSQEMAAGALSIKIGKRPRDLLNPKGVKYMQSVFSIKDAISKKESREISALCGVTVTQVRDFFASQRSRVRKFVRLSREKAIRSSECKESQEGSSISDPAIPINQVPLNSMGPNTVEEAPSCSVQEETFPGVDDSDKTFLHNIFNLMRTEETFSGQVKLMEWILKIQNSSVLNWFLTKGGVMILATWLSQAALEEQTTVLLVIFKVLCHLPLHKALPAQMSAILQIVNRLRFYRTSDISNRARVLLSRWSKIFVRSQAMKKPCSMKLPGDAQKEIIQTQRDGEILSNESWPSETNIPEEIFLLPTEAPEAESTQPLKLLPSSTDYLNKKNVRSVSSSQTRERRKVLLVEQPGQKTINRSLQVGKAVPVKQGRPLSADDIQKAKMRAMFMQDKYGKTGSSSDKSCEQKTEHPNKFSPSQTIYPLPKPKALVSPKTLEETKPTEIASKTASLPEAPPNRKSLDPLEHLSLEKLKRDQIPWQMPPEIRINSLWRVGTGEKSKEVEIQTGRNRREKETIYQSTQHIPLDPKEPWDVEMDHDDSLTPEIPIEQPPDADGAEAPSSPRDNEPTTLDGSITNPAQINTGNAPEPDLELLAVLLKNPELVFALTSGQNGSLTTADTVKLLDMIKASKISSPEILDGFGGMSQQKVEVTSLPSPTPSTDPLMRGWVSEGAKDSVLQQCTAAARSVTGFPVVNSTTLLQDSLRATNMVQHQVQATNLVSPQGSGIVAPSHQQPPAVMHPQSMPQPVVLPEKHPSTIIRAQRHPLQQTAVPEAVLPVKHFPAPTLPIQNPLQWVETSSFGQDKVKPAAVSIMLNQPKERHSITLPSLPLLLPTPLRSELSLIPEAPPSVKPLYSSWPQNSADLGSQTLVLDSRGSRQGSASYAFTQANQNGYNLYTGGPGQPQQLLLPGGPWGRNEVVDEPELEMWSPERSPVRSPENRYGHRFQEFRRDYGRSSSRPDWSRDRSSGYRDHNKHGSRRWRDRRR